MEYNFRDKQILSDKFIKAYNHCLENDYRFFYDDLSEYGSRDADTLFYFVPGINGVPSQIRFIMPSILKNYGKNFYVKCCDLDEFDSRKKIWDKYTLENVDKKKNRIVSDLNSLAPKYSRIRITVSSSGFYDFVYAYSELSDEVKQKSELLWASVAPDNFEVSPWQKLFYKINGFKRGDESWFAFPNHNYLQIFNPEASMNYTWKHNGTKKVFSKHDFEVRFKRYGMSWGYASTDCFNKMIKHQLKNFDKKIDIPAQILVATNDGYWQGKRQEDIDLLLDKYLEKKKRVVYKKNSHLWLLIPDNLVEFND